MKNKIMILSGIIVVLILIVIILVYPKINEDTNNITFSSVDFNNNSIIYNTQISKISDLELAIKVNNSNKNLGIFYVYSRKELSMLIKKALITDTPDEYTAVSVGYYWYAPETDDKLSQIEIYRYRNGIVILVTRGTQYVPGVWKENDILEIAMYISDITTVQKIIKFCDYDGNKND